MLNQILFRIKSQYRGAVYYTIGILFYLWLIISVFPSIKSFDFNAFINQMPDYFKGFYNSGGLKDISSIEGFLSGEILSFFLIFITAFFVAGSAASSIAGTIEKKTLDFSLSQPVSRTKYFIADFLVTEMFTVIITGIALLSIKPLCSAYNISISMVGLTKLWFMAILMLSAIYGISLLASSILRSKSTVISLSLGITFAFYMITTLASAIDKIKALKPYSLYYYYKPYDLMTGSPILFKDVMALLLVFAVGSYLALVIYNKKDI